MGRVAAVAVAETAAGLWGAADYPPQAVQPQALTPAAREPSQAAGRKVVAAAVAAAVAEGGLAPVCVPGGTVAGAQAVMVEETAVAVSSCVPHAPASAPFPDHSPRHDLPAHVAVAVGFHVMS